MVELEDQLRRYGAAVVDGVEPVSAAEAASGTLRPARLHLDRRGRTGARPGWRVLAAAAAVVALVVVSVGALIALRSRDGDEPIIAGPVGGTTRPAVVYLLDAAAFAAGREPYVVTVARRVPASTPEAGALDALFEGATAAERDRSLQLVTSGATGYTDLHIAGDVARLQLTGECSSGGSTFTVADLIIPTLEQFGIETVKIYDADGTTQDPDGPSDSVPSCLEP